MQSVVRSRKGHTEINQNLFQLLGLDGKAEAVFGNNALFTLNRPFNNAVLVMRESKQVKRHES